VHEYTLSDAINDDVLTPYNYHIYFAYLEREEQEEYSNLSYQIGILINSNNLSRQEREKLAYLCGKRSRLLGAANQKFIILQDLVSKTPVELRPHSLFYCAEGYQIDEESNLIERQISRVSKILSDAGWRTSQFTSMESPSERRKILESFIDGAIEGLVSMKVLDEGVDVPACSRAYILASTRNPRQYIQRRGRILRKSDGKELADIYDFLVLPHRDYTNESSSRSLIDSERERAYDFLTLARNKSENMDKLDNIVS
jgi:superfamily II DNA or RNA helicase